MKILTDSGVRYFWNKIKSHIKAVTDDELAKKFDKANVVEEVGDATDKVIAQKTVTGKFFDLVSRDSIINISTYYNSQSDDPEELTIQSAVEKVPESDRKFGFCGIVLTAEGWKFIVFRGNQLSNWNDLTKWDIISVDQLKFLQRSIPFLGTISTEVYPEEDVPTDSAFYLTSEIGDYNNFYGLDGNPIRITDYGLHMFKYTDVGWEVNSLISIVQEMGQSLQQVMSQKAITDNLNKLKTVIDDKLSNIHGIGLHVEPNTLCVGTYNFYHFTEGISVKFVIGIGASNDTRLNALVVLEDGSIFIKGVNGYEGLDIPDNAESLQDTLYYIQNDISDLLSNTAIYVAGGLELAESGIDYTTVIDSPYRIIYDKSVLGGRFLARKDMTCYAHWKADISKNIAPPSRYGIETDNGVFPFNNQTYKFSTNNNVYIANCSNGTCTMKKLTLRI